MGRRYIIDQGSQTRGPRAACGPRWPFVRPAILFGNLQITNIYVAKCHEKRCCEIIKPKLNDQRASFLISLPWDCTALVYTLVTRDRIYLKPRVLNPFRNSPSFTSNSRSENLFTLNLIQIEYTRLSIMQS